MKRPPIVMLHGAFCGPWAFDKFRIPFEKAGYKVHAPALRFHEGGAKTSPMLGTTSLLDYAADLEAFIATLPQPPSSSAIRWADFWRRCWRQKGWRGALVLLAPCAPWGVLPSTLMELASAQTMFFAGDYWNQPLKPAYWIAASNSLDHLPPAERHKVFARFVPESGLATFEIMHWPLDVRRAAHVPARKVTCPILCMVGDDDKINPPATVRRVAERYRGGSSMRSCPATATGFWASRAGKDRGPRGRMAGRGDRGRRASSSPSPKRA